MTPSSHYDYEKEEDDNNQNDGCLCCQDEEDPCCCSWCEGRDGRDDPVGDDVADDDEENETKVIRWKQVVKEEYSPDSRPPSAISAPHEDKMDMTKLDVLLKVSSLCSSTNTTKAGLSPPRRPTVGILKHNKSSITSNTSLQTSPSLVASSTSEAAIMKKNKLPIHKKRTRTKPTEEEELQYALDQLTAQINKAAKLEAVVMKKAKLIRERRRILSKRYEVYGKRYQIEARAAAAAEKNNDMKPDIDFVPASLPPLLPP